MVLPESVPGGYRQSVSSSTVDDTTRARGIRNAHLAAASHELRGPLNVVIGMADTMIQRDGELDDEVRSSLLRRISASGRKMDRILNDLFEVLRDEDGEERVDRTPVDLDAIARRAVERSDALEGRAVSIEATGTTRHLDERMVDRILDNLVSNAAKHAGPEARIWIRVSQSPDGVSIAVDDDGPGVPEHERQRIFERFERGSGVMVSGLGIGLSVVSRFAQLHGGRAWVEPRIGGGSSFRVYLPSR